MLRQLYIILLLMAFSSTLVVAQPAPANDENIPYLITFGGNSDPSWGDDDFCQIFFFVVPYDHAGPVYLRIFDPDTGGDLDEVKGDYNTSVSFSLYGGTGCWSDTAAQSTWRTGNYQSGYQLSSRPFGTDAKFNKQWYTMGPVNPFEGEDVKKLGGHVFKIIAQGVSGDDGNIYRYYLSTRPDENKAVEGGNFFTYKYHFRLSDNQNQISQIYPFVDERTVSVEVANFDWDDDGIIRVISVAKNGLRCDVSGENNWSSTVFPISEEEKNTTLEIQFIKNKAIQVKNNNVVVTVKNQYGITLPFYVIPIGGIPVYSPKINMR